MGKRHEAIGIKQAIRFEWMQKAANLLLAGLEAKTIRQELHEFLTLFYDGRTLPPSQGGCQKTGYFDVFFLFE